VDQVRNELPDDVEQIRIMSFGTDDIPVLFVGRQHQQKVDGLCTDGCGQ
jgi:hypothetical protein